MILHGFLHAIAVVVAVPYIALAASFLLVGELARSRGLFGAMWVVLDTANSFVRWGMYVLPVLLLALLLAGFAPATRWVGAVVLVALATLSLLAIVVLHSGRMTIGQITFLLPCVAAIAAGVWLLRHAPAA